MECKASFFLAAHVSYYIRDWRVDDDISQAEIEIESERGDRPFQAARNHVAF